MKLVLEAKNPLIFHYFVAKYFGNINMRGKEKRRRSKHLIIFLKEP